MAFEYQTLCGTSATGRGAAIARWLLPAGALVCLWPGTPTWAALGGGAAIALTLGNPCAAKTAPLAKWLLQIAVVGLGAGINLGVVAQVGLQGLGYTLAGLALTFGVGLALARWLRVPTRPAALVCAGTGICGGSAIAATAPAIGAEPAETSSALATVFLLNAIALVIFPPLGAALDLSPHAYGLWCALAIHDTSSVTGAALTHGTEALAVATTVKLARALWIVPVALLLGWWFQGRHGSQTGRRAPTFPWFIAGFMLLSALFTFWPGGAELAGWIGRGAHMLLSVTLFFIGAGLDRRVLGAAGARPLVHGVLLWLVSGAASLAGILFGWIR